MLVEVTLSLVLASIGTIISIVSMIFAYTNSAKHLEHRLTSLELKVEPLWNAIINEIPKLLIRAETPELDKLLRMASNGLDDMTDKQIHDMARLLNVEFEKAIETGEKDRAFRISLYRATLKERLV